MFSFFAFPPPCLFAVAGLAALLAAPARPAPTAQKIQPPARAAAPQVRLAIELTRTDTGSGAASATAAARTIAAPALSAFSRGSASVQVNGNEFSYSVSVSPDVERDGRVALLWTLQLTGKTLPGATSVNVAGGARVAAGKRESIADITLRDPKTGRASRFGVYVTALTDDGPAVSAAPATFPAQ